MTSQDMINGKIFCIYPNTKENVCSRVLVEENNILHSNFSLPKTKGDIRESVATDKIQDKLYVTEENEKPKVVNCDPHLIAQEYESHCV